MMFTSLRPQAAPARLTVARSSQRVFSDAEWDAATKTASKLLEASEVAVEQGSSETAVADAAPPPAGRTFSDAQWDQALKEAPMLLKTLQDIEEGAASGESASTETASIPASSGVNAEGSVFTPEQWEAAIKAAAAIQKEYEEAEKVRSCIPRSHCYPVCTSLLGRVPRSYLPSRKW